MTVISVLLFLVIATYGCANPSLSVQDEWTDTAEDVVVDASAYAALDVFPDELPDTRLDAGKDADTATLFDGYWGTASPGMATTVTGNTAAISCHNCYLALGENRDMSLAATLGRIAAARDEGADLIELDVKEQAGLILVDHDDDGGEGGALLEDVLADEGLRAGREVLFIEIKEQEPTEAFVAALLDIVEASGCHSDTRPVVLRAFRGVRRTALEMARDILEEPAREDLRAQIRLQELFSSNALEGLDEFQDAIQQADDDGFHGVEFQYQDRNLVAKCAWARQLGLGTNLWTIPSAHGDVAITALRETTDAITVDYPIPAARDLVEADDVLVSFDARRDSLPGADNDPSVVEFGRGDPLFGPVLRFDSASGQRLVLPAQQAGSALHVTLAIHFARTELTEGESMTLVHRGGEQTLHITLANWGLGTRLHASATIEGLERSVSVPASALSSEDGHLVTLIVDAEGSVDLFVDLRDRVDEREEAESAAPRGDENFIIGAALDEHGLPTDFFSGEIQFVRIISR